MYKKLSIAITLFAAAGAFSTAQAAVVCGAVIKTAETLTANLTCSANNPALTIQGPGGSLNMGGNTLSCGGSSASGIKMTGSNGTVQNGTVSNCAGGILLFGTNGMQVSNMTLQNNSGNGLLISKGGGHQISQTTSRDNGGRGFVVNGSGNNTFSGNEATGNNSHGYELLKGNNTFTSNRAASNNIMGFQVTGSGNTFSQNTVQGSGKDGFNIFGSSNRIMNNTVSSVSHDGIEMKAGASGNTISDNNVSGSGIRTSHFDLKDVNADCGSNVWTNNTGIANQPCAGGSGPPTGGPGTLQFTAQTYNSGEGDGTATVTVSRSNGSTGPVSVAYTTAAGGSATEGADYTFTSGVLNWADGDAANKTFSVPIIDDSDDEDTETVNLSLSNPDGGATLGTQQTAALSIADNDTVSGGASCAGQTATIVGTDAGETINGTAGPDVIAGLGGNDTITGKAGADIICGGAGDDQVAAGTGDDQLLGEDGNDRLDGSDGVDSCDGGSQTTSDRALNCETTTGIP